MWFDVSDNRVENMIAALNKLSYECIDEVKQCEEMILSEEYIEKHKSQTCCHIRSDCFSESDLRCRDHDRRTGKFRGMSHNSCNLNYYTNFNFSNCISFFTF